MGTHDQVSKETVKHMTKFEYQYIDTLPSVKINVGINDQQRLETWEYMTKHKYQYRYKRTRLYSSTGI